jgi:hypothetical protein
MRNRKKGLKRRYGHAMKTIGYQVLVFNSGASYPETVTSTKTEAQAERLRAHFEHQARERGWNKRVEIRPVRR